MNEETIKATILYHLRRKKVIGGVHTSFDTLTNGFPGHLGKEVTKIANQLIKKGIIITKPAAYGLQVLLDKKRIKEIDKYISEKLEISV